MKKLLLGLIFTALTLSTIAQGIRNIGANIVIESGASLYIDGNSNGKYTNETTGGNHGEIDLDGDMYVEGDWNNNATVGNVFVNNSSPTWGTVFFNGTTGQNIGGTATTYFENVRLSNSLKTLTVSSTHINNLLFLVSADLDLNKNTLTINTNSPSGLTASAGYGVISEANSANFGIVEWKISSATGSDFTIPFIDGAGGTEIPLIYKPNSGSTGLLQVATYNTPVANTPLPPTVNHLQDATTGGDNSALVADRFWMIDVSGTGVNADITFESTAAEVSATVNPRAQRWLAAGDGWEAPQGVQSNPTANSVKAVGVTGFNTWWIMAPLANPLPIDLLSFNANCANNVVTVEWSTATEINNDYFTIKKSMNGQDYETVAIIPGAGNSNKTLHYSFVDNSSLTQTTYYRLSQTDYDGESETFNAVSVKPCKANNAWSMVAVQGQNNAVRITFQSSINDIIQIEIFDMLGNKMTQENIELFGGYQAEQFQVNNLLAGIYVGTAKTNDSMQTLKFVVKD